MRPPEIEHIRNEVAMIAERSKKAGQAGKVWDSGPNAGLLRTKTVNDWMKQEYGKPMARSLFGGLWFEGELCIMFADTNLGKSVLAVQIGDCLTKAYSMEPFVNQVDIPLPVLYIDFELSAKQFEARYVDNRWGSYLFAENFYRSEFNAVADDPILYENYEDYVKEAVGLAIIKTNARVLIIDNITYMRRGTEQAKDALPLMKTLKALKTKYNLSMLVLAHTPKRSPFKPLTVNDLQGSKMLINFADSAFAIGQSHAPKTDQAQMPLRYLKQIKQRNQREQYGENNICLIRQQKHLNFLRYTFEGYATEQDHLRRPENQVKEQLYQKVTELSGKGQTCRQIADELGIHFTTAGRIVQRFKMEAINSEA